MHELSPVITIIIIKYLCVHKSFFSGISLDAHLPLVYVENVITLHTELELLLLTGQQNRKSYEHINYSVFHMGHGTCLHISYGR